MSEKTKIQEYLDEARKLNPHELVRHVVTYKNIPGGEPDKVFTHWETPAEIISRLEPIQHTPGVMLEWSVEPKPQN